MSSSNTSKNEVQDTNEISNVLNRDKKSLSDHGQKLFDAINYFLDDDEQRLLTQALFKYQQDHNVFTLVRSCREVFDTKRKKSLMLFMRPVIPIRDRFHYDEYYKLFFPEEFDSSKVNTRSIFADLIPSELIEKTIEKANAKAKKSAENGGEKASAAASTDETKTVADTTPVNLDFDINQAISAADSTATTQAAAATKDESSTKVVKIGGFRIIELAPQENESLGFNICLGPTQTFIMVSYVEANSSADKLGMKIGDEIVSVNEVSLKMTTVDEAIDILSSFEKLQVVLQTSGFMPEDCETNKDDANAEIIDEDSEYQWIDPFSLPIRQPNESKKYLKSHLRTISIKINKRNFLNESEILGISIRGGVEYELGIFVVHVEPNSLASKAGLRVGDQILKVNRQSFAHITLLNALNIFKTSLKLALSNVSTTKTSTLNMVVRYIGKLPTSFTLNLKDINLSYLLISNNNELKKRLDARFIQSRLKAFNKQRDSIGGVFKKANLETKLSAIIKQHFIDYLKFNLNIDYLIYLFKLYLKKHVEIVEKLREFVYDWDLELYDCYTFDLKFSLLTLHNRNLKKQINYENFEKPETLFNLNYLQMKSTEDLRSKLNDDNEDDDQEEDDDDEYDSRKKSVKRERPKIKKIERSKSLDNLDYFISTLENDTVNSSEPKNLDEVTIDNLMKNYKIPRLVSVEKTRTVLGLTIYGGVDTKQIIPNIVTVQPNSCASSLFKEGQLVLNINQSSVLGLKYRQVAQLLQDSFKNTKKNETLDFVIAEPNDDEDVVSIQKE